MRALKLAGLVTCGLALSVTNAAAAPQVLDDSDLDGVVAGVQIVIPGTSSQSIADLLSNRPTLGIIGSILRPVQQERVVASNPAEPGVDGAVGTAGPGDGEVGVGGATTSSTTTGELREAWQENSDQFLALYPTPPRSAIPVIPIFTR